MKSLAPLWASLVVLALMVSALLESLSHFEETETCHGRNLS